MARARFVALAAALASVAAQTVPVTNGERVSHATSNKQLAAAFVAMAVQKMTPAAGLFAASLHDARLHCVLLWLRRRESRTGRLDHASRMIPLAAVRG